MVTIGFPVSTAHAQSAEHLSGLSFRLKFHLSGVVLDLKPQRRTPGVAAHSLCPVADVPYFVNRVVWASASVRLAVSRRTSSLGWNADILPKPPYFPLFPSQMKVLSVLDYLVKRSGLSLSGRSGGDPSP